MEASDSDPFGIRPAAGRGSSSSAKPSPQTRVHPAVGDVTMQPVGTRGPLVDKEAQIIRPKAVGEMTIIRADPIAPVVVVEVEEKAEEQVPEERKELEVVQLRHSNKDLTRRLAAANTREAELRSEVDSLTRSCDTFRHEAATTLGRVSRMEAAHEAIQQELVQAQETARKQTEHRTDLQRRLRQSLQSAAELQEELESATSDLSKERQRRDRAEKELETLRETSRTIGAAEREAREALTAMTSRQAEDLERRAKAHAEASQALQQARRLHRWSAEVASLFRRVSLASKAVQGGGDSDITADLESCTNYPRQTSSWLWNAHQLLEQVCAAADELLEIPSLAEDDLGQQGFCRLPEDCEWRLQELERGCRARTEERVASRAIGAARVGGRRSEICRDAAVPCEALLLPDECPDGTSGQWKEESQAMRADEGYPDLTLAATLVDSQC